MKKKIIIASLAAALLLMHTACDDKKDEYLSDFSTILYFRNSGELPLNIYNTGDNADYTLVVNKSGFDLGTTTAVTVAVMDEAALQIYNAEEGTSHKALPANCYELVGDTKLNFSSSELYKQVNVMMKTSEIQKLATIENVKYVIPVQLINSEDSINSKKNIALLIPSVLTPTVSFIQSGYVQNFFTDSGAAEMEFKLSVGIPLASQWSFNCEIAVDQTLLDAYNKENDCDYALLPKYEMSKSVAFSADGSTSKDVAIKVNRSDLEYGNYVLPVLLKSCSKPEFKIDEEKDASLYGISYVPDASKLSSVNLTANMLSSNSAGAEGTTFANLLDGNVATHFHSVYDGSAPTPHWLQVALVEPKTAFQFSFTARSSNGNGTPALVDIEGSMDGITFSKIGSLTEGFPPTGTAGAAKTYTSPVMVGKAFKYVRLKMPKNQSGGVFFVFSEFSLKTL